MADMDFSKQSEDERLLVISFDNQKPMRADQVASILKALDSDYRQMTGRDLVLARLEIGSTWIWLTDILANGGSYIKSAAEIAKAAQDLGSFAKKLRGELKPTKIALPGHELTEPDDSVDKTVVALAKVAAETHSTVRFRKITTTDGKTEQVDFEVTPSEFQDSSKRVKKKPKKLKKKLLSGYAAIPHEEIARTMRALPAVTGDTAEVVTAMVQALIANGAEYMLEQVASTLEIEGRWDIATIIRQQIGKGRGHMTVEN